MPKSSFWLRVLVGLGLDLVLAATVSWLFQEPHDGPYFLFFLTLAFLLIAPLILGLWFLARVWLGFFVFGQERGIRTFLHYFKTNGLPHPAGQFDIDQYLVDTADRTDIEDKPRIAAAIMLGELKSIRSTRPFSLGFQATILAEKALNRYDDSTHPLGRHYGDSASDIHAFHPDPR
jgi:hypothetical protein